MTDQQLYLSLGVPLVAILSATVVNVGYFNHMTSRFQSLEMQMSTMETRIDARATGMENRFSTLENRIDARMHSLEGKFDILIGKVVEVDNRLTRLEAYLKP